MDMFASFPLELMPETKRNQETIKWTLGANQKHEIVSTILNQFEPGYIVAHCLQVMHKVNTRVGDDDGRKFQSYRTVLPRTLSIPLLAVWENIQVDFPLQANTVAAFHQQVRHFIAANATENDRLDLVAYLRKAQKPVTMNVQAFFYRLRELNDQASWLPGNAVVLTAAQIDQAFHDGMPVSWRNRYANAGRTLQHDNRADLLRFFRLQEHRAERSQRENDEKQRAKRNDKRQRDEANKRFNSQLLDKNKSSKRQRKSKAISNDKKDSSKISPESKCPIHPRGNHTWGECFQNAANANKKKEAPKKDKKDSKDKKNPSNDGNALQVDADIADEVSDEGSVDSVPTSVDSDVPIERAINDQPFGDYKQEIRALCDKLNKGLGKPSELLAEFRARQKASSEGMFEAFVSLDAPLTHHLDQLSFLAMQETNSLINDIVDSYVKHSDDCYSLGVGEINIVQPFDKNLHLRATSYAIVQTLQKTRVNKLLKVLFDSGSDKTMFNRKALPPGINPSLGRKRKITGVISSAIVDQEIVIEEMTLPEFSSTRRVSGPIRAIVMDQPESSYDIIIGMDLMQTLGIDIHNTTKTVVWDTLRIPFKPHNYFESSQFPNDLQESMAGSIDDPTDDDDLYDLGYKSKNIRGSLYTENDPRAVAEQQTHLSPSQRQDLMQILSKYPKLFSGQLGVYPHRKIHLELKADAVPSRCRPYPVPRHHEQVFKDELDRLCAVGVLSRCGGSEWLSPSFIIPKKDARVRWISDFRELNKFIKRKVYNLPKIQDILQRRSGYAFFSKLDISMQYYTFELDDPSKELCTICTPFGNCYNRLPMGISQSPDIAQEIMEDIFRQFNEVDVYIDDIGVFSNDWQSHCKSLTNVLALLEKNNFIVNPFKCEWAVQETDWLGYWLTPTGLKPWKKKIAAILALEPPTTVKQLRSFLGAVTFYRDMFPKRSHILAPLTALATGRGKVQWSDECQKAFDTMKAILAKDAFIRYPDHNKPFHIYCDASDLQLGAVIIQDDHPVAYYSRKLNAAQRNYTVGEKELLSIVETLKEYRTMLYGCPNIHIYTDHRNNTFKNLQTQRVLRWRLFLEDYGVHFEYIKGETNTLADALSRLPFNERQNPPKGSQYTPDSFNGPQSTSIRATLKDSITDPPTQTFYSLADDDDLLDCFVHLPATEHIPFVLDYQTIAQAQAGDAQLPLLRNQQPNKFTEQLLAPNTRVWCYTAEPNKPWRIYLPGAILPNAIRWYHHALSHIGTRRLTDTMSMMYYNPKLKATIEAVVAPCAICQQYKNIPRGHGETAPREAALLPWSEIAVDLIGPWTLEVANQRVTFHALTIIDLVTNLVEVVRLDNKTSAHVAMQFVNTWLARYPKPTSCVFDQGGEFIGWAFQHMLEENDIQRRPTTTKNPQANAICERMHQSIGNSLRVLRNWTPPDGVVNAQMLIDAALANAMYATRASYHSGLRTTPGALAFHRDMVLNIPVISDLQTIREHRQHLIDQRLIVANRKRFAFDYQPNQEVLKLAYEPGKLEPRATGPFRIAAIHTNGTVTLQLTPHTTERISLRNIKPFRR
jgi:hypothetical protein